MSIEKLRVIASGRGLCSEEITSYGDMVTVAEAIQAVAEVERLTAALGLFLNRPPGTSYDELVKRAAALVAGKETT